MTSPFQIDPSFDAQSNIQSQDPGLEHVQELGWPGPEAPPAGDLPPGLGKTIVPHYVTFSSIMNYVTRTYRWTYDAARKHSDVNALAIRRDPMIMEALRTRQMPTAQLAWHIDPLNPTNQTEIEAASYITDILNFTPRFQQFRMHLLEAIWYGRHGVANTFRWNYDKGERRLVIADYRPVNGDKLVFKFSGQVGILVHQQYDGTWQITDRGRAHFFTPAEREQLVIHKHEPEDADFFEGELAGGIHGYGIRGRVYYLWWLKTNVLTWLMDYLERVGAGGFTIYFYEHGNDQSRTEVMNAAQTQLTNNVILFPRYKEGGDGGPGIQRIEPSNAGANLLQALIGSYFDIAIRRYICGMNITAERQTFTIGSGSADLDASTFSRLVKYDAENLDGTLTSELLPVLYKYNCPGIPAGRFKSDVEKPNVEGMLQAAKYFFDMGGVLDENEIRGIIGLSAPQPGHAVLSRAAQEATAPAGPGVAEDAGTAATEEQQAAGQEQQGEEPVVFDRDGSKVRLAAGLTGMLSPSGQLLVPKNFDLEPNGGWAGLHPRALRDNGVNDGDIWDALQRGYARVIHWPKSRLNIEVHHSRFPQVQRWARQEAANSNIQHIGYTIYGDQQPSVREEHIGVDYAAVGSPEYGSKPGVVGGHAERLNDEPTWQEPVENYGSEFRRGAEYITQTAFKHKPSGQIIESGPVHNTDKLKEKGINYREVIDGFLTNRGRFLNRRQAYQLLEEPDPKGAKWGGYVGNTHTEEAGHWDVGGQLKEQRDKDISAVVHYRAQGPQPGVDNDTDSTNRRFNGSNRLVLSTQSAAPGRGTRGSLHVYPHHLRLAGLDRGQPDQAAAAQQSFVEPNYDELYSRLESGGFSHHVRNNAPVAGRGFAVSVYPDRGQVVPERQMTAGHIKRYLQDRSDIIRADPDALLGAWRNNNNNIYLNISHVVPTLKEAIKLGRQFRQKAVWDFEHSREVPVTSARKRYAFESMPLTASMFHADLPNTGYIKSGRSTRNKQPSIPSVTSQQADESSTWLHPEEHEALQELGKAAVAEFHHAYHNQRPPLEEYINTAKAGHMLRHWYSNGEAAIKALMPTKSDAFTFAGLNAALSPHRSPEIALHKALDIYSDWTKWGRPEDPDGVRQVLKNNQIRPGTAWHANAVKSLRNHGDPSKQFPTLSGYKVGSFGANLAGDVRHATMDSHMSRFEGVPQSFYENLPQYLASVAKIRAAGSHLQTTEPRAGWTTPGVQATIWGIAKGLADRWRGKKIKEHSNTTFQNLTHGDVYRMGDLHSMLKSPKVKGKLKEMGLESRLVALQSAVAKKEAPRLSHLAKHVGHGIAFDFSPVISRIKNMIVRPKAVYSRQPLGVYRFRQQ